MGPHASLLRAHPPSIPRPGTLSQPQPSGRTAAARARTAAGPKAQGVGGGDARGPSQTAPEAPCRISSLRPSVRSARRPADLLSAEPRGGCEISCFKRLGPFWGCNSAEISVSRRARSIGDGITRSVPAGHGDHVQIAAFLAKPARETFKNALSGVDFGADPPSGRREGFVAA